MSWILKPLGSLLEQSGYIRAGNGNFPVLSITMKHGLVDQANKFKKRVASQDTSNYRVVYKNELVVGFPIDEGVLGFQTKYPAGIVSPAYEIWRLKNETISHIPYLERFLRSPQARRLYASKMQGAVARRRSLTKGDFQKLEIPFPPYNDQVRIAQLLSKVEELISQRKQQLQQLDDLLKSVFLEMFGDPAVNIKGWKIDSLANLGAFKNGMNFSKSESGVQVRCLGVGDFKALSKITDIDHLSIIDLDAAPSDDYFLRNGDLIFVRSNGNRDLVGRCIAIYPNDKKITYSGFCIRFRISQDAIDATYLTHLFRATSFRRLMLQGGQGANIQNINQQTLSNLPIPVPPPELQKQFAHLVETVETTNACYQQSLAELENLYGVLSQKAFKGELDLSRVDLSKEAKYEAQVVAPVTIEEKPKPVFMLPAPTDLSDLSSAQVRMNVFGQWLDSYLEQLCDEAFSAAHFMEIAQQRLWELLEDDAYQFSVAEYDHVKQWLFNELDRGRISQQLNIISKPGEEIINGNQILLKKAP